MRSSAHKSIRRVLLTTDAVGGVWNYTLNLIRQLIAHDIRCLLAVVGPAPSEAQSAEADAIRGLELIHKPLRLEWMADAWADVEATGKWLTDVELDFRPDIVHLSSFSYGSFQLKAPTVLVAHSCVCSWWRAVHHCDAPEEWNTYRAAVTAGLRSADAVVAPTSAMLASLRELYDWSGRGAVIPHGVTGLHKPTSRKSQYLLSIGRLWDMAKNFRTLDLVAKDLPWPFYIAGECAFKTQSFHPAAALLLGYLPSAQLQAMLDGAPIYVHPARYEPFGLSILEAANAGAALVLSDIGSLRELWDGAALFFNPDAPEELKSVLHHLILDPSLTADLSEKALNRAARFDIKQSVDTYMKLYESLLSSSLN